LDFSFCSFCRVLFSLLQRVVHVMRCSASRRFILVVQTTWPSSNSAWTAPRARFAPHHEWRVCHGGIPMHVHVHMHMNRTWRAEIETSKHRATNRAACIPASIDCRPRPRGVGHRQRGSAQSTADLMTCDFESNWNGFANSEDADKDREKPQIRVQERKDSSLGGGRQSCGARTSTRH